MGMEAFTVSKRLAFAVELPDKESSNVLDGVSHIYGEGRDIKSHIDFSTIIYKGHELS